MTLLIERRRLIEQTGVANFPYRKISKTNFVPLKVGFFMWTLLMGMTLIMDGLKKEESSL